MDRPADRRSAGDESQQCLARPQAPGRGALFMIFAPLEGRRRVEVRERRTAVDYAHVLKEIADVDFSDAEKIVLVQDNLNTHKPASLYQAFPAAEARRLAKRFEWHYTPKHGSWLDMAESELSVLSSQCLDRRIPNIESLTAEVASRTGERNAKAVKADWQFTTDDARIKLKRLYPQFECLGALAPRPPARSCPRMRPR